MFCGFCNDEPCSCGVEITNQLKSRYRDGTEEHTMVETVLKDRGYL